MNEQRLEAIKHILDDQLREHHVYDDMKKLIRQFCDNGVDDAEEDGAGVSAGTSGSSQFSGKEKEVLERLLSRMKTFPTGYPAQLQMQAGRRFLRIHLDTISSIVDLDSDGESGLQSHRFQVCICWNGTRYLSEPFTATGEETVYINDDFFVPIPAHIRNGEMALKSCTEKIQVLLVRRLVPSQEAINSVGIPESDDERRAWSFEDADEAIGIQEVEWRRALFRSRVAMTVEMNGYGDRRRLAVAVLRMKLEVFPQKGFEGGIGSEISEERLRPGVWRLSDDTSYTEIIDSEKAQVAKAYEGFFRHCRKWWKDFVNLYVPQYIPGEKRPLRKIDVLRGRAIPFFGESELGDVRPITTFVQPFGADNDTFRCIEHPQQAARFVSLLPVSAASNSSSDVQLSATTDVRPLPICSLHTFLSTRCGDTCSHAILLCSLLLGFGLDAWVVYGFRGRRSSFWVLTRSPVIRTGHAYSGDSYHDVHFWDPVSGRQFALVKDVDAIADTNGFHRINCVFNHEHLYAFSEDDNRVYRPATRHEHDLDDSESMASRSSVLDVELAMTSFDFEGDALSKSWRPLYSDPHVESMVRAIRKHCTTATPSLFVQPIAAKNHTLALQKELDAVHTRVGAVHSNSVPIEYTLESKLRTLFSTLRRRLSGGSAAMQAEMKTSWNRRLEHVFGQALCSYETERLNGFSFGNHWFQSSIRSMVQTGEVFKAMPVSYTGPFDLDRIVLHVAEQLVGQEVGLDILKCSRSALQNTSEFAVRTRMYIYPENLVSIWMIFACKYVPHTNL